MKNILFTIGLLALSLNISTQDQEYTNAVAITSKNSITGKMETHYVHTGNTKAILPVYRFLRVDRLTETVSGYNGTRRKFAGKKRILFQEEQSGRILFRIVDSRLPSEEFCPRYSHVALTQKEVSKKNRNKDT